MPRWQQVRRDALEFVVCVAWTASVGVALGMVAFALVMLALMVHADPLPAQRTLYAPPVYDGQGTPLYACLDECWPKLWVWPYTGQPHTFNLVGVRYDFWNPPLNNPQGTLALKSKRAVLVQYWSRVLHAPAVGDTIVFDRGNFLVLNFRSLGAEDFDVTTLARGAAVIDTVQDSVLQGHAWLVVTCPGWSRPESLTTTFRLVHEAYRIP